MYGICYCVQGGEECGLCLDLKTHIMCMLVVIVCRVGRGYVSVFVELRSCTITGIDATGWE